MLNKSQRSVVSTCVLIFMSHFKKTMKKKDKKQFFLNTCFFFQKKKKKHDPKKKLFFCITTQGQNQASNAFWANTDCSCIQQNLAKPNTIVPEGRSV